MKVIYECIVVDFFQERDASKMCTPMKVNGLRGNFTVARSKKFRALKSLSCDESSLTSLRSRSVVSSSGSTRFLRHVVEGVLRFMIDRVDRRKN